MAEAEKDEHQNIYFRNSRLEELLVEAGSVSEMAAIMKDKEYLIPDGELLSLNLLDSDGTTVCRYLTNSIVGGGGVKVGDRGLFPKEITLPDHVHNYHVLPIVSQTDTFLYRYT